ncbi:aspartate kinase [Acetobacteraceae bacterium]|nr:aspartate kinase [Candidatus Parcubacteria bacterium]
MTIALKFGGSSLADISQIQKAVEIVRGNPERKYVVVSAPGKRSPADMKMTDIFYHWHEAESAGRSCRALRKRIFRRYADIVRGFGLYFDVGRELNEVEEALKAGASRDFMASRGEYLMAKIFALILDYEFVDAAHCIRFDKDGKCNWNLSFDLTYKALIDLGDQGAVIPGFYGADINGKDIVTFSRGGSDVTGAIVARAVMAKLYENWTDVDGLYCADPTVVKNPLLLASATYAEVRELSYMGAKVVHPMAMYPVARAGIPTRICNTNNPKSPGTLITSGGDVQSRSRGVAGVAGRAGFAAVRVERALMNEELGDAHTVLGILLKHRVRFDHSPGGIDTMSYVIDQHDMSDTLAKTIVDEIREQCMADDVRLDRGIAMIAIVGEGMVNRIGMSRDVYAALAAAGINVRIQNQGSSELNILVGVNETDYERAIQAIYNACIAPVV